MTNRAHSTPLPGSDAEPAARVPVARRADLGIDDFLEGAWHLLTSMRFGIIVILALAFFSLIGTLVIQIPAGTEANPAARAEWLNEIRPRFGGWTDLMDRLGFFNIFQSLWFRGLTAFLAASLIACSSHRFPGLVKAATKPHIAVGPRFFEHAPQHDQIVVRGSKEEIQETLAAAMRKRHYRVLSTDDGIVHVYADRFRWAPMGTVVAHLSLVVILAGAMVGSMLGFRDGSFMIPEGSTVPVAATPGLEARLISFEDSYHADTGAPADYVSDLVLLQDGQEVARQLVRVNHPLRHEGLTFYQSFYGPAAAMRVADPAAGDLYADGVPLAWTAQEAGRKVGTFTVPDRNLTVWVVGTSGSRDPLVKPGQMRVEVYGAADGRSVAAKTLDQGVAAEVAGLTFTFERELKFTGLSVANDPGTPLVWLGSLMLIVGSIVVLTWPHRRVWARVTFRAEGVGVLQLAGAGKKDLDSNTEFTNLVVDIRAAFAAPAKG
jgi:cytochrome c biogenesis protein